MDTTQKLLQLILSVSYTRTDANRTIELITKILEKHHFSGTSSSLEKSVGQYISENALSTSYIQMLEQLKAIPAATSATGFYPALNGLSALLQNLPVLTVYTPVELEAQDIERIGKWARSQVADTVLLSFMVNPAYIGGCGISWQGRIKDYGYSYLYEKQSRVVQDQLRSSQI